MTRPIAYVSRSLALALVFVLALALGCTPADDSGTDAADDRGPDLANEVLEVRFGTLPTEDALPFWVAESEGLFEHAGLTVSIETFDAAAERDTAMTAGSIDCMMGDLIATALLEKGGFPVSATTIMLGAKAGQGRFGIVTTPGSEAESLADLAGVPIGTSTGTIQEYVVDSLFAQAGIDEAGVVKEEVKKVPVRFELLMQGQLAAAALPEPLLSLAEFEGGTIVADDTQGENITQTVLIADDEWLSTDEGTEAMTRLLAVWDEAVTIINGDPDAWRDTLVEKARLPEPIKETYAVNAYPEAQAPGVELVVPVVEWMRDVGLIEELVSYEELIWSPDA
jgi:NitT/TauT family transport system substrate-binding protein